MITSRNSNKRFKSTKRYIDKLGEAYSKLNIVRIDLGYKKPHSQNITLEDANKDLNCMLSNMRFKPSIFRHKVGYVCKIEYTKEKGVHLHMIIIFDGQKVKRGEYKADEIGKYWEEIVKEKGSYHNCHRNTYKKNGIGMLDYRDSEKRKILDEYVISYLCKDEQDIEVIKNDKRYRAFRRGTILKRIGNIGRPRTVTSIIRL
ncbi:MAG: Unknown protein [uncultured Sulfurovum sp.]|uniref:YagK/YfjJ C-terminal domain-containing protein n=1 Tax=uncultured Sulfurovum sp. TaxID=269237 RepID=A0A6S6TMF1_9BACT|nr:MAG: Unknown protein [uncultured Sulfurovum sp.]